MELRKVQLTGGSSLSITLPRNWTDKTNLQAGDVVGCIQQPDGSLAVHPHAKGDRELQRYVVEITDEKGEHVFRKLVAAYLMGYDAIHLTSKKPLTPPARTAVRQAVRRIMGLEVVEEEPNGVTVQDFLDPKEFHMEKALRRMAMLTQAMQEEAFAALREGNADILASLNERDDEVDRLYWLVNKQYHAMMRDVTYAAKMELTTSQALNHLLAARLIERTADHAARIATHAVDVKRGKPVEAFLLKLDKEGKAAADLFRDAVQTFLRKDSRKANAIVDGSHDFVQSHGPLLKEAAALGGETVSHLVFVIESINRTAAYAADISEIAINHAVASPS